MSSRIAHRPRYRNMKQLAQSSFHTRQDYLRTRWVYRKQTVRYEKHPLGYGLSLLPIGYRLNQLMRGIIVRHA